MKPSLKFLNYIALAVFGIAVIRLGLMGPGYAVPAVFNLLPFGIALLAAMPDSRPASAKVAVVLNIIWAALVLLALLFMIGRTTRDFLWVAAFCLPVAIICFLNSRALWPRAFSRVQG